MNHFGSFGVITNYWKATKHRIVRSHAMSSSEVAITRGGIYDAQVKGDIVYSTENSESVSHLELLPD